MLKKKILLVFGTRPEAIKLSPLIKKLKQQDTLDTRVCVTAQHRHLLDQVLDLFQIKPEYDLDLMKSNQDLTDITVGVLTGLRSIFSQWRPDAVLVHGDTTTTFSAALAAYYEKIPLAHIEAGLRTFDIHNPWPEEGNRTLVSAISRWHFAPTEASRINLISQGVPADRIHVTGNTAIDALKYASEKISSDAELRQQLKSKFHYLDTKKKLILLTIHRRENFGENAEQICDAIVQTSENFPDTQTICPLHPNPNVRRIISARLGNKKNIHLTDPLDYISFIYLMNKSSLILTDSGGLQEEAPSFNVPLLLLRESTERPEAISEGFSKLVGSKTSSIISEVSAILKSGYTKKYYEGKNPYGDGFASVRISSVLTSSI